MTKTFFSSGRGRHRGQARIPSGRAVRFLDARQSTPTTSISGPPMPRPALATAIPMINGPTTTAPQAITHAVGRRAPQSQRSCAAPQR
jgi:hypothetical protein